MTRAALVALALAAATDARADFVRGTIKVDVRDQSGKPREADVTVRGPAGAATVARVGEVYVADGLVGGDYTVSAGGDEQIVHVEGRLDRGVVFVVGGGAATKKRESFALGPRDVACDPADGVVVEAVVFARGGGLGAGRIDVRRHGGGNKLVCSAIVAGGAATLRLHPGDYLVSARTVGGGSAIERYELKRDRTPQPLALRAR